AQVPSSVEALSAPAAEALLAPAEGEMPKAMCCADPVTGDRLCAALEKLGYRVLRPGSPEEAVDGLRFSRFSLVVYQDGFDKDPAAGVHGYLCSVTGEERRGVFVVWIGNGIQTGDLMMALSKSVDLVMEERDVDRLRHIVSKAMEERQRFYGPFREILRELGLAITS
ncbi:MAG: hypothetical protein ACUVXD_01150, partial [Thermodesulfobacteriota bacterium]